jgi:RNA polymerase sigma factor (sigma-70 family)
MLDMDIQSLTFTELLQQAIDGSTDAAETLHRRFASHLRRVIRRKLAVPLRRFFDSHDFLQDVWASFYASPPAPGVFTRPQQLVAYLASIASNKVTDAFRNRIQTIKHNANRQVSMDVSLLEKLEGRAARTPTPSQVFAEQERWDHLIAGQTEKNRRILELLRQGYTHEQVADAVQVNEKTVRRFLQSLAPQVRA